jgi:hypothetical protein
LSTRKFRQKGEIKMTTNNEFNQGIMKAGQKPRAQNRLPQGSYIQADQWMDYLGYEQYCWWVKFHTWVDRTPDRVYEQHIPYTLESVFKKLGVSQTTFYRKIKVLWECGLIDFIEFGERKTQKPKNIIVYEYPFNNAVYEYSPLEKRRDWVKDYASESVLAGIRGARKKQEMNPPKSERVEESTFPPVDNSPVSVDNPVDNSIVDNVDNLEIDPPNSERVDPPKSERVTLPDLGANNYSNNITNITNKLTNISNNSLSQIKIDLIQEQLKIFDYQEGEREKIIELIIIRGLFSVTKQDIAKQAQFMATKSNIRNRPWYFVEGLKMNEGRTYESKATTNQDQEAVTTPLPFYNWLER